MTLADIITSAWLGVIGVLGAGMKAWIAQNERLTRVETRQESDSARFDQIMTHLQRIEDKLDNKADK